MRSPDPLSACERSKTEQESSSLRCSVLFERLSGSVPSTPPFSWSKTAEVQELSSSNEVGRSGTGAEGARDRRTQVEVREGLSSSFLAVRDPVA